MNGAQAAVAATPGGVFAFGDFLLDVPRRELRRVGKLVKLQPKAFDMLAYLVENAERVVSKDQLLSRIWPRETVSEWSLTFSIKTVRKALGDAATSSRL